MGPGPSFMAVPSREVGVRYCAPVLTNPEVFLPGGVFPLRRQAYFPDILVVASPGSAGRLAQGTCGFYANGGFRTAVPGPGTDDQLGVSVCCGVTTIVTCGFCVWHVPIDSGKKHSWGFGCTAPPMNPPPPVRANMRARKSAHTHTRGTLC